MAGASPESTTSDGVPESICDPQPQAISTLLVVDDIEAQFEHAERDRVLDCTVASIEGDADVGLRIELQCTNEDGAVEVHTLDVAAEPSLELPVEEGLAVRFHVVAFVPWWGDLYVTLRGETGELLLGFLSAGGMFEGFGDVMPDPAMFAPVELAQVNDACALDCEDAGSGFLMDPCPCMRRKAIDFTVSDDTARIFDRDAGSVGVSTIFDLRVESAQAFYGPDGGGCEVLDSPHAWHEILMVRRPT